MSSGDVGSYKLVCCCTNSYHSSILSVLTFDVKHLVYHSVVPDSFRCYCHSCLSRLEMVQTNWYSTPDICMPPYPERKKGKVITAYGWLRIWRPLQIDAWTHGDNFYINVWVRTVILIKRCRFIVWYIARSANRPTSHNYPLVTGRVRHKPPQLPGKHTAWLPFSAHGTIQTHKPSLPYQVPICSWVERVHV